MAAKQDLVLGAVSGLGWVDIEVWAHSLTQSGFSGIRAMIVYGDSPQVVANLKAMGFQVLERPLLGTIWNHRFRDFHDVVRASADELRYCVITDVRDVYFQTDPMAWLERNLTKPMLAASESIRFRDEVWNRTNFEIAFPDLAGRLDDLPVYNVGVLAGEARTIADLTLAIALMAKAAGAARGVQGPGVLVDQGGRHGAGVLRVFATSNGVRQTSGWPAARKAFKPWPTSGVQSGAGSSVIERPSVRSPGCLCARPARSPAGPRPSGQGPPDHSHASRPVCAPRAASGRRRCGNGD